MGTVAAGPDISRLTAFALTPQERMEIGKQAVEVHKQVLESLKTPSEIERNLGLAANYRSQADFQRYKMSAQGIADEMMIHAAGPMAQMEAQKELIRFGRELEEQDVADLTGKPVPSLIAWATGEKDMGALVKLYGKKSLGELAKAAMQYRIHADNMKSQQSQTAWIREAGLLEKTTEALAKLKAVPSAEEWARLPEKEKFWYRDKGILSGRTPEQDAAIKNLETQVEVLSPKVWGPGYKTILDAKMKSQAGGGTVKFGDLPSGKAPAAPTAPSAPAAGSLLPGVLSDPTGLEQSLSAAKKSPWFGSNLELWEAAAKGGPF